MRNAMRLLLLFLLLAAMGAVAAGGSKDFPNIPAAYLEESENIPGFWLTTADEVGSFLDSRVRAGRVETVGTTAGGRHIRAVFYGKAREGKGTTTFSGSLGFRDVRAYTGPDHGKKVYLGMASVHGGEFEGIAGIVNLLSVLETGKDLRGKEWPEIVTAARALDRIILIPIMNLDGRARVPIRMERFRGWDETVHEYLNTGGRPDGKLIGWPQVKEFIPLDFSTTQFPGGYPNDAGVNIQHDDFFGRRQPETQALFDLCARERPDLIMNLHTGAVYPLMHRPFAEAELMPAYEELFRRVQGRLAVEGLQETRDPKREGDSSRKNVISSYNLDTALNLHCGALSVVVESPTHGATHAKRGDRLRPFTPDELVDAQLLVHLESMKCLSETGGRDKWTPMRRRN